MWPDAKQTKDLLADAEKGDAAAVDRLLAEHREPLRQAIRLRLDPALARRVDASDIVQEVMIEASRRMRDYLQNPALPFGLWLRQLAKDRMIDAHRFHRQAQRRSVDREQPAQAQAPDASSIQLIAQLIDPERTPGSAALQHELERRLDSALGELNDDDREIILMRHYEQQGNQEVAAQLGLSEAAASMRYLRALRRLRTHLTGDEE